MLHLIKNRSSYRSVPIDHHVTILDSVEISESGSICRTSKFVTRSVADLYGNMSIFDFSIDNILASGATNMLNPVMMSDRDFGSFDSNANNIIKLLSNEKAS